MDCRDQHPKKVKRPSAAHITHANAELTPTGRLALARCIFEDGWPSRRAAERFQVSHITARRRASRYRAHGEVAMVDASSRPARSRRRTPTRRERRVVNLRQADHPRAVPGGVVPAAPRREQEQPVAGPVRGTDCDGPLRRLSLAHRYETDIMEISFAGALDIGRASDPVRYSLLFALLEGASSALDISRDDINGALFRRVGGAMNPVLFDTVPGGAGGPARIAANFPQVLEAAHARVDRCDCGVETSCYSCLRNYRNQHFHDRLRRDAALGALESLLG